MSNKHFIALAEGLRNAKPINKPTHGNVWQWSKDVKAVAAVLGQTNPNFDLAKFLSHVGLEPELSR